MEVTVDMSFVNKAIKFAANSELIYMKDLDELLEDWNTGYCMYTDLLDTFCRPDGNIDTVIKPFSNAYDEYPLFVYHIQPIEDEIDDHYHFTLMISCHTHDQIRHAIYTAFPRAYTLEREVPPITENNHMMVSIGENIVDIDKYVTRLKSIVRLIKSSPVRPFDSGRCYCDSPI